MEIKLKAKYKRSTVTKQKGGHNDGLRGLKRIKVGRAAHEKRFGPQRDRIMIMENNKIRFEDL